MADETIWKLDIQPGNSQATLAAFENSLNAVKSQIGQVTSAGENFSKLESFQVKAAEAGKRLEVAQASAALAMKKAQEAADGGKASTEQVALAQARAALAAEKVNVAENAVGTAMGRVQAEADRLTQAMQENASKTNLFAGGIEAAKNALGGMGSGVVGAAKGIWDFANKAGQAVFNLQNLYQGAVGLGQALIGSNASMEQTTVAFTQLLGSSSAANAELKDIQKLAADTPFEFPDVADAVQKFLAFQIPLKDTKPLLIAIGDALSGLGKNTPATLSQVVDVFGQMNAAGKIQTQDLMQLTSVGINGFQLLADQMHKPVSVIKDMVTSGVIPAKDGIEMLRAGMEKTFGGGMQAQSKTFNGLLSTFQDNAQSAMRAFTGPLFDMAKNGLVQLGNLVSSPAFQQFATDMGTKVGGALQSIGQFVSGTIVPGFQRFADTASKVWKILDDEGLGIFIASIENLAGALGQAWLAFTPLGIAITNIFDSGVAVSGANALVVAFYNVSPAIDAVSNGIKSLTGFFQSNSIQAQIVKDLLIGIGVAFAAIQIGAFLATLPALIAGFIAWGIAAWGAAAGVIAATWPLLLIGAAIALVVAGIILAVQHWGDITKFLQGVWSAFSAWFMGALAAIGAFFVGVWNGIVAGLKVAWDFIVNVIKIGALLALAVLFAPIVAMAALFIWLYNHNYYFKALVDGIVSFFQGCFAWCVNEWHGFVGWLGVLWAGIAVTATAVWNYISGAIKTAFSASIGFVAWVWGVISSFFANAWSTYIARPLTALWQNVSNVFSSAWGTYIAGPIGSLWTSISTTVGGWATKAVDWGKNLIQSFIDGIKAKAVAVGTALADTAKKIANFLGFHSPTKEGPGSEADQWAPNFIKMYTSGLEAGIPQIQAAMNKLAMPISANLSVSATSASSQGTSQSGNNDQVVGLLAAILDALQKQGRGGGITMNANVAAGSVDAQRINQIVQSLGGKAAEMMQRGGG